METYVSLKAKEFVNQLINDQNAILLDVRTSSEFNNEHIANAILAPRFETILTDFDKNKNYYVHCRVGGRCAIVAHKMVNAGFRNVFNLNDNLETMILELEKVAPPNFTIIRAA